MAENFELTVNRQQSYRDSTRVGIFVSADIHYRPIYANIGKTDISVSVV